MIKAKKISKQFHRGVSVVTALHPLDLSVAVGERLGVVGPSGSGKTTLLSLLSGLEKPDAGELWIGESELSRLSEAQLSDFRAQSVGIVFQQFHLMPHLTALENVCLPLELIKEKKRLALSDIQDLARQMLGRVKMGHRIHHLPAELSGGESQRVAIARALVAEPAYVFADEPSGNLDSVTGDQVMQVLFDLVAEHNTTLILVTHNHLLAEQCDRQIEIRDGHIQ